MPSQGSGPVRVGFWCNNQKLVPAKPSQMIGLAQRAGQGLGDPHEGVVTARHQEALALEALESPRLPRGR
jgi:hypothetical protein